MMKKFLESIINWKILILTSLLFAFFIIIVLPYVSEYGKSNIGGIGSPDTEILISGEQLYKIAESYGNEGRETYVFLRWTFDVVWPIVYMTFLLSLIIALGKTIQYKWAKNLYLFPIGAMLFDYLENTFLTIVMIRFPVEMFLFGSITSYVSLGKWIILNGSFVVVLVLGMTRLIIRIKKLNKRKQL